MPAYEEPIAPDPAENEDAPENVKNPARGISDEEVEGETRDVDEDPATDEPKGVAPGDI
jgi:hypothetical protein